MSRMHHWHALLLVSAMAQGCSEDGTADSGADGGDGGRAQGDAGMAGTEGGGAVPTAGAQGGATQLCTDGETTPADDGCNTCTCMDGTWACSHAACSGGDGGAPPPSCSPALDCGTGSCCESLLVPGGTYNRGGDPAYSATVGDFLLDKYEVTVGRFRRFVEDYDAWRAAHPTPGEGARPGPASLEEASGWNTAWDAELPETAQALLEGTACHQFTWTDETASDEAERYPINCVDWFTAFAFCLWDGGWLPTEAEWEYAAAGGDEQRPYPWGERGELGPEFPANCAHNHFTPFLPVGSEPAGDGRWGQSDLGGSQAEWNLDWFASTYTMPCDDCANLDSGTERVVRGGHWSSQDYDLATVSRDGAAPSGHGDRGIRCVRTP